ncbi:SPOR domain-containing protein [Hugenholtzia roseola]|uniref:SPOR domain-containing protein n=1 Tax=Hugenholtzia roseola TaxID=1002 RepID=UPI00042A68AC|nr:SPOR domain-containing protein [Hugenholtzia roseola]
MRFSKKNLLLFSENPILKKYYLIFWLVGGLFYQGQTWAQTNTRSIAPAKGNAAKSDPKTAKTQPEKPTKKETAAQSQDDKTSLDPNLPQDDKEGVIFFEGTYEKLKEKAQAEKKPYLLYFYNRPTQYDSTTFRNQYVAMYGNKRYLFFKVKAYSLYSDYLIKTFEVKTFPQVCIVTPEGKLLARIEGYVSPQKMMEYLRRYPQAEGKPDAPIQTFARSAEPELSFRLRLDSKVRGLYRLEVHSMPIEAQTLGVQVGVFEEYEHLLAAAHELGENWHRNIMVAIVELDGKKYYRLLLAPFYSYEHALAYQKALKEKKGLYGMIVRLDEGFMPVEE